VELISIQEKKWNSPSDKWQFEFSLTSSIQPSSISSGLEYPWFLSWG
jgi:hypothetical protein